jgi:uncharacterized protein (TIGR02246 family)
MSIRGFAVAAILAIGAACSSSTAATSGSASSSPAEVAAVRSSIEAANARFFEAFKKGDKAGLMANYADDAVVMMPNEPQSRGRAAIEQGFTGFLSQVSLTDGTFVTGDVMVSGDVAVETGTFAWTLVAKDGTEMKDNGKYVTVWKRQADGAWKIVRDINNSDLPAAK